MIQGCLFFGGPLDGQRREVRDPGYRIHVPLMSEVYYVREADAPPLARGVRSVVYERQNRLSQVPGYYKVVGE